jgi:hypothetical protein
MSDWKTEIQRIKGDIRDTHGAIEKYLQLTDNPNSVPVEDLLTVCQLTGIFSPGLDRDELVITISEFMVYHGFDPVPNKNEQWEKLPFKRT